MNHNPQIVALIFAVLALTLSLFSISYSWFRWYRKDYVTRYLLKSELKRMQVLTEAFNKVYIKTSSAADDEDWLEAALIARQIVKALGTNDLIDDSSFYQVYSKYIS